MHANSNQIKLVRWILLILGIGNVKVRQCHANCRYGSLDLRRTLTDIAKQIFGQ